jgi:hypothetical protein
MRGSTSSLVGDLTGASLPRQEFEVGPYQFVMTDAAMNKSLAHGLGRSSNGVNYFEPYPAIDGGWHEW